MRVVAGLTLAGCRHGTVHTGPHLSFPDCMHGLQAVRAGQPANELGVQVCTWPGVLTSPMVPTLAFVTSSCRMAGCSSSSVTFSCGWQVAHCQQQVGLRLGYAGRLAAHPPMPGSQAAACHALGICPSSNMPHAPRLHAPMPRHNMHHIQVVTRRTGSRKSRASGPFADRVCKNSKRHLRAPAGECSAGAGRHSLCSCQYAAHQQISTSACVVGGPHTQQPAARDRAVGVRLPPC